MAETAVVLHPATYLLLMAMISCSLQHDLFNASNRMFRVKEI